MSSLEVLIIAVIMKSNFSLQFCSFDLGYTVSYMLYYLKLELHFAVESEVQQKLHVLLSE